VRRDLPSGTVTFLFTDVEGSTNLLHSLGAEGYAEALAEHRRAIREACASEGGVEVDTQGDAFFFAFPTAPGALTAAAAFTESLASGPVQVRVGLHTGTPLLAEEGYVGGDVHRAARIAAAGHGGQVLVSSSTAQLVERDLRDLGEHRLKDLSAPERIYQLGDGDFPALKSLYRTNLPVPATPFLGRERELADVAELLAQDNARLLTLTGPGGTGKTRLALQAAGMASDAYPDGVWWVPLAPLRDPELVLPTAAQVLGSKNGLVEHIQDKSMLCLFDNFEQVVEAAPDLAALVGACPNLDVLVTSRERLRVGGEQTYPVPPLAESDGEALFLTRARAVDPAFAPSETVSALCLHLDELPLAIELAAARTALFSPEQLLAKLAQRLDLLKGERDADPRQQTLRATIEWSHDLLSAEEQRLFRRLAVFSGGCTYEAAEEIAGADPDMLQSLLDKSLLRKRDSKTGPRYWMLETIREFAIERLVGSKEADTIRDRHVDWFLALAEGDVSASSLDAERDNIRAALDWAGAHRPETEARLIGAVAEHWLVRGYGRETHERLSAALERYSPRDRVRARLLTSLADVDGIDEDEALSYVDDALVLWRELGDASGEASALETLGWIHDAFGNYDEARLAHEQSLAVRLENDDPEIDGWGSMAGLCHLFVSSGQTEDAESMARELLDLGARHAVPRAEQLALHFLADCPLVSGDYPEAERRYLRALAHARASRLPRRVVDELLGVAMSASGQGDARRAVRLAAAAYAEADAIGKGSDQWWSRMQEWFIGGARAQFTPDELEAAELAAQGAPFEAVLDEVLGVDGEPAA
jgi:predicted ATPase/class 3 adenylate cyclase